MCVTISIVSRHDLSSSENGVAIDSPDSLASIRGANCGV